MDAVVVNDLLNYNLKIVQNNNFFKFSIDSVALADFVNIDFADKSLLDLCSGTIPIPLILSKNINNIVAIELQKEIYDLGIKSIELNKIRNIRLINDNMKNLKNYFPGNNFDIVTCNPPYFEYNNESVINSNQTKAKARHEIEIKLKEVIDIAYNNLRDKGKFYLVHRPNRLAEIICLFESKRFGIKRIQLVYNNLNSNCSAVLIEAKKNSKSDIEIIKPLYSKDYRR